jgi:hypothetical protein
MLGTAEDHLVFYSQSIVIGVLQQITNGSWMSWQQFCR